MKKLFLLATLAMTLAVTGASFADNTKSKKKKAVKKSCNNEVKSCNKYKAPTVRL